MEPEVQDRIDALARTLHDEAYFAASEALSAAKDPRAFLRSQDAAVDAGHRAMLAWWSLVENANGGFLSREGLEETRLLYEEVSDKLARLHASMRIASGEALL